jgi:hypothetical protein
VRRRGAALAALAGLVVAFAGCGGHKPPAPTPTATPSPAPTATPVPGRPSLAVGITEPNANLVSATAALPEPWAGWRDALGRLHPAFYRLVLDWPSLQPSAGAPANLAAPNGGCMRMVQPCLGFAGVRDQLRALASRQRQGGWVGLAVITGTPDWAAEPPSRCDRPGTPARARPPRPAALAGYRRLVSDVLALARREGADLRYWSAWNEPNHPDFLSPPCGTSAAAAYTPLARALHDALAAAPGDPQRAAPGDPQQVLGETAGLVRTGRHTTSVARFIGELPSDLVCSSTIYDQHAYVGGADPVDAVARALAAHHCARPHSIWITETGVGPAPRALSAAARLRHDRHGCEALHRRLVRWWHDPRVTAAFQYTLREDDRFPTGLVSTDLTRALPALGEWTAWGSGRPPGAPPPGVACGGVGGAG